ncbi:hypothetical protein X975_06766, partial [Stegodyphus mimosarum]
MYYKEVFLSAQIHRDSIQYRKNLLCFRTLIAWQNFDLQCLQHFPCMHFNPQPHSAEGIFGQGCFGFGWHGDPSFSCVMHFGQHPHHPEWGFIFCPRWHFGCGQRTLLQQLGLQAGCFMGA